MDSDAWGSRSVSWGGVFFVLFSFCIGWMPSAYITNYFTLNVLFLLCYLPFSPSSSNHCKKSRFVIYSCLQVPLFIITVIYIPVFVNLLIRFHIPIGLVLYLHFSSWTVLLQNKMPALISVQKLRVLDKNQWMLFLCGLQNEM